MEGLPETIEFGPYRLKARIAEGGMAEVILATSPKKEFQGQFIAIKKLLPHLNSNKAFVDLLIHEAKIGVLLNHPGIASVYDLGSHKSEFFIAMEYVHGKSLDRVIEKIQDQRAPRLPVEVTAYIILEVLRALGFAHQLKDSKGRDLNIIHRDISPGNILLGYRGEVKLVDFGIATAESRLQKGFSETAMGKLAYMAPEQAVNDPVVKASDIYSLGVVFYELLTGQLPFQAENANALLKKVIDGRATDMRIVGPAISAGLRDIITMCLNKSSRKRYQSSPDLFAALVAHFRESLEIDFTARATREYYKKKLTEYLRSVFEREIIDELEIVQKALKDQATSEEHKITAPQEIPKMVEADFDATVFEPDHTDEATRHYPLTEDERRQIMKGLPPREVIQRQAVVESASTKKAAPAQHSIFNLATIPEYELAPEDSHLKRISVKEKLAISSLDKENKESLKMSLPAQEITTQHQLEEFEQNTFSGEEDDKDRPTRPLDRDQILKDFNEIRKVDVEPPPPTWQKISAIKNVKSETKKLPSRETMSPRAPDTGAGLTWMLSIIISLLIGMLIFFSLSYGPQLIQSLTAKKHLLPRQTIALSLTGEVGPETLQIVRQSFLQSTTQPTLQNVSEFFDRAYERYSGERTQVLKLELNEGDALIKGISQQSDALQLMGSQNIFDFLAPIGFKRTLPYDAMIYIYVFPYEPKSSTNLVFPQEFSQRRENLGIVFAPHHSSRQLEVMINLIRQIAFIYGARDARDPELGFPINPEGLSDPQRSPLFPQLQADIMGRDIAMSSLQKRAVEGLDQLTINAFTAHQLGWITDEKLEMLKH